MALSVRLQMKVHGVPELIRNLDREFKREIRANARGLHRLGERVLEVAIPKTPKETGFLRGEIDPLQVYVSDGTVGLGPAVEVGYKASYAALVHEIGAAPSGKAIDYTTPGTGWKFLERAVQEVAPQAPAIVAGEARIP